MAMAMQRRHLGLGYADNTLLFSFGTAIRSFWHTMTSYDRRMRFSLFSNSTFSFDNLHVLNNTLQIRHSIPPIAPAATSLSRMEGTAS